MRWESMVAERAGLVRGADGLQFAIYASFAQLLASHLGAMVAIDIPIGLTETGEARTCDIEARRLVGLRRSSIFPAPDRRILQMAVTNYVEACA
jgi:predicted RNase H-like nuclease